jgi:hypothetical protein
MFPTGCVATTLGIVHLLSTGVGDQNEPPPPEGQNGVVTWEYENGLKGGVIHKPYGHLQLAPFPPLFSASLSASER